MVAVFHNVDAGAGAGWSTLWICRVVAGFHNVDAGASWCDGRGCGYVGLVAVFHNVEHRTRQQLGGEPITYARMHVIVDLCVVPIGVGVSVSEYIAACERLLTEEGFDPILHPYGTVIEGEWNEVFAAVRRCHEVVHEMGAPRVSTSMRLGTRTDRSQTARDKVKSVEDLLAGGS